MFRISQVGGPTLSAQNVSHKTKFTLKKITFAFTFLVGHARRSHSLHSFCCFENEHQEFILLPFNKEGCLCQVCALFFLKDNESKSILITSGECKLGKILLQPLEFQRKFLQVGNRWKNSSPSPCTLRYNLIFSRNAIKISIMRLKILTLPVYYVYFQYKMEILPDSPTFGGPDLGLGLLPHHTFNPA